MLFYTSTIVSANEESCSNLLLHRLNWHSESLGIYYKAPSKQLSEYEYLRRRINQVVVIGDLQVWHASKHIAKKSGHFVCSTNLISNVIEQSLEHEKDLKAPRLKHGFLVLVLFFGPSHFQWSKFVLNFELPAFLLCMYLLVATVYVLYMRFS